MSETIPSFDDYRRTQIHKAFRNIGSYLVSSLIKAGECMSLNVPKPETSDRQTITDAEIQNFVSQSETIQFDREFAVLVREYPIE